MKIIQLSRASRPLAEYARDLNDEIVVLTDRESLALSAHPEFLELIERSRAQFAAGKTLSLNR